MNTIYLALSTAVVLLFSFVFYKTRDMTSTPVAAVGGGGGDTLFFTTPIRAIIPQQQPVSQSACVGGCSWTETTVGYAGAVDPYASDSGSGTLPYDLQSQPNIMDTMPFDGGAIAAGQTDVPGPSFTVTPDPVVDFIPDQTIY
jgi:hypothetical protein